MAAPRDNCVVIWEVAPAEWALFLDLETADGKCVHGIDDKR
jgi:hypothetical protein